MVTIIAILPTLTNITFTLTFLSLLSRLPGYKLAEDSLYGIEKE